MIEKTYKSKLENYQKLYTELKSKDVKYSLFRLFFFLASVALIIYLFTLHPLGGMVGIAAFLLIFNRILNSHSILTHETVITKKLSEINEAEINALKGELAFFDDGEVYIDVDHLNAADLDLFGQHSVFQNFNRCGTAFGRETFAGYLTNYCSKEETLYRQEAIQSLHDDFDWRQRLLATALLTKDDLSDLEELKTWLELPPMVKGDKVYTWGKNILPFINIAAVAMMFYNPWWLTLLILSPTIYLMRRTIAKINIYDRHTSGAEPIIKKYSQVIKLIENHDFKFAPLQKYVDEKIGTDTLPSSNMQQLSKYLGQLHTRNNMLAIILQVLFLWDLQWIYKLDVWRINNKANVQDWFEVVGTIEALCSMTHVLDNNPSWIFPAYVNDNKIDMIEIGHPLIPNSERITNTINLSVRGHIKLLTGSNMAGKSTFLRTVGLNLVLGMAGFPVCAQKLSLTKVNVYTSMRTNDDLHENTSSFYAELKRLKVIIEAVEEGDSCIFLLDEILKGTNSVDRHKGSKALIKQLLESEGGGIIATHDLELGELEANYDGKIENLRMEVDVEGDRLKFRYKVERGVSKSFNASILMKQMGIKM